jgi:hypothetical protein
LMREDAFQYGDQPVEAHRGDHAPAEPAGHQASAAQRSVAALS